MAFVIMPFDKKLKWSIKPMTTGHDVASDRKTLARLRQVSLSAVKKVVLVSTKQHDLK